MRHSLITKRNPEYEDLTARAGGRDNLAFFDSVRRKLPKERPWRGAVGLVGGTSLTSYTLRHAQAILRWDFRPSYWSHCFLIAGPGRTAGATTIWECPVEPEALTGVAPERSGVKIGQLGAYRDRDLFPNVALISFALAPSDVERVLERAADPNIERLRFNLWVLIGRWLAYAWTAGQGLNPLAEGVRIPSAAYVEMAYEAVGIDLTPGASERNSSPEHLWQTALWWWQPFRELGKSLRIDCCIRQRQALLRAPMTTRLPYRGSQ